MSGSSTSTNCSDSPSKVTPNGSKLLAIMAADNMRVGLLEGTTEGLLDGISEIFALGAFVVDVNGITDSEEDGRETDG